MSRKIKADSTTGQVKAASDAKKSVSIPAGVTLDTEEARILWNQITSARAPDAWRSVDLLLAAKWVGLEMDIRKYTAEMGDVSVVDGKANPLLGIIDTVARQQNSIMRLLSLGTKANRAAVLNAGGKRAIDAKPKQRKKKGGNVVNLLA